MAHQITLRLANQRRAIFESRDRFEVLLNGKPWGELYFNMRGYVGTLPLPDGRRLTIGERGICEYRREIARINREAKS